jgi:hypothetical protein
MRNFTFTDINGMPFEVEPVDFYRQLSATGFKVLGFDMPALLELNKQYCLRRGPMPPTPESIREVFEQ